MVEGVVVWTVLVYNYAVRTNPAVTQAQSQLYVDTIPYSTR